MGYTNTSLFTTLPSPTICGLQASTTHFSDPPKNAMPQISPNLHSIGGKQKKSTAQKVRIFTCFRTTPTRSDPQAANMHSTGGPSATRFFTRFRRTPTRSDPAAAILHSTRGPSVRLRCAACDEQASGLDPSGSAQVRPLSRSPYGGWERGLFHQYSRKVQPLQLRLRFLMRVYLFRQHT